jgi:CRP-like cAMP-binding protein
MPDIKLETRSFAANEDLFKEGEHGNEAYLITSGYVTVWRMESGQRVNVATLDQGAIIGEMALVDDTVRSATVTAQEPVEVEVITEQAMSALMAEAPDALTTIVHQLMESLRCSNDLVSAYAARLVQ